MNIFTKQTSFNSDIYTPVELYMSLRNSYRKTCLLESNDYHSRSNSKSFIGLEPIIEIKLENQIITIIKNDKTESFPLNQDKSPSGQLQDILDSFHFQDNTGSLNGFFGRIGFEFSLLEESHITKNESTLEIPDFHFFLFKHVIVIDHFKDNGYIITNSIDELVEEDSELTKLLIKQPITELPFRKLGMEEASFTDDEFSELVDKAKAHCQRGDVFQLVLSNSFSQSFFGDDFQVYRQ